MVQAPAVHVDAEVVGPAATDEVGVPIPKSISNSPTVGEGTVKVHAVPLGPILMAS